MIHLPERLLERVLEQALRLDPDSRRMLQALGERYLVVEIDPGGPARLVQLSDGVFRLDGTASVEPDVRARGSATALAQLFFGSDQEAALEGLEVEGDVELLVCVAKVLRGLDPDWEEPLSTMVGDVAAHHIGRLRRGIHRWLKESASTVAVDLGEQLQHESRLVPSRAQWHEFAGGVGDLAGRVEALEGRLERLRARRGG